MELLRSRKARFGLLCLLTILTLLRFKTQWAPPIDASSADYFPPEGKVTEIDTGGKVPGNPANAVADMRQIRVFIDIYKKSNGHFPEHIMALYKHMSDNSAQYGISDIRDARYAFMNPDSRYSDDNDAREHPDGVIPYQTYSKRPDGTLVGSPKAAGKRDILVFTPLYRHENIRRFKTGVDKTNPAGFFVVMWDDGSIENIPYNKRLYVPVDRNTWSFALPGQAGVPASALTYDRFNRQAYKSK